MTKGDYRAWLLLLAMPFICVGILLTAHPAEASPVNDRAFILALDEEGIAYPSAGYAIRAAKTVCGELDSGLPVDYVVTELAAVSALTLFQAGYFTGVAIAAYCPQHLDQVYGTGVTL